MIIILYSKRDYTRWRPVFVRLRACTTQRTVRRQVIHVWKWSLWPPLNERQVEGINQVPCFHGGQSKLQISRRICIVATHPNDSNRYAIRNQALQFPVRLAFAMTINKAQGKSSIATSVWTEFGKSMLLTWSAVCGLLTRRKTFWFIYVRTRRKNKTYCVSKCTSINSIEFKTWIVRLYR